MRWASVARALGSQVKPRFSAPAVAMAVFGGLLAPAPDVAVLVAHGLTVGLAMYVAHLRDSYVDFFVREEDETLGLSAAQVRRATLVASAGVLLGALALAAVDPVGGLLTAALLGLAWLHAPVLDTNPVTTTLDYPVGIGCAILAGSHLQAHAFDPVAVALAATYVVLLAGLVVRIDLLDYRIDRSLAKRTVPVVLGPGRARLVAAGLVSGAMALVVAFVATGVFPPLALLAAGFPPIAVLVGRFRTDEAAFALYMASVYPVTVVLFAVLVWPTPG